MKYFLIALVTMAGCGPMVEIKPKEPYILHEKTRPTHWTQGQWDTLNRYLKRIDELEKRVEDLERNNQLPDDEQ